MGKVNITNDQLPNGVATHADVSGLQKQLNAMGANLAVDGVYGPKTQAAYNRLLGGSSGRSSGGASGGNTRHTSGYAGTVVKGDDGNSYTEYGALLREDGFFYPEDAKISPNGMYFDIGNGWQFAKHAVAFDGRGRVLGYVPGDMTGAAPGTVVKGFERTALHSRNAGGANAETNELDADEEESEEPSLWEQHFDELLDLYNKERFSGYGM